MKELIKSMMGKNPRKSATKKRRKKGASGKKSARGKTSPASVKKGKEKGKRGRKKAIKLPGENMSEKKKGGRVDGRKRKRAKEGKGKGKKVFCIFCTS